MGELLYRFSNKFGNYYKIHCRRRSRCRSFSFIFALRSKFQIPHLAWFLPRAADSWANFLPLFAISIASSAKPCSGLPGQSSVGQSRRPHNCRSFRLICPRYASCFRLNAIHFSVSSTPSRFCFHLLNACGDIRRFDQNSGSRRVVRSFLFSLFCHTRAISDVHRE